MIFSVCNYIIIFMILQRKEIFRRKNFKKHLYSFNIMLYN